MDTTASLFGMLIVAIALALPRIYISGNVHKLSTNIDLVVPILYRAKQSAVTLTELVWKTKKIKYQLFECSWKHTGIEIPSKSRFAFFSRQRISSPVGSRQPTAEDCRDFRLQITVPLPRAFGMPNLLRDPLLLGNIIEGGQPY